MSERSDGKMDSESSEQVVVEEDISKLLRHFVKNSHRVKAADIKGETIMECCMLLFAKDYKFTVIPNLNGELCGHYPMKLIITEFERGPHSFAENFESCYNAHVVMQKMKNARCARCRSRFVVPVIFYQGKHICRSATLSGAAEMFGRSTTDYLLSNQNAGTQDIGKTDMFDKFRGHDIQLLKFFDVGYICDLMVEKKKTKFGMPISSSEKVDKENRYSDFTILGMPYPGCEFFKDWKDNSYLGETTMYDWAQALNDSSLDVPDSPLLEELNIDWSQYTEWNLIELTQNYFKLLLKYIAKGKNGLLIHCISGWDRTPLFISLLRLSLWADGAIHRSLSATEILYLTLGYDWYLFGHDLPDRLNNDQEVLYFCFKVLKDIATDDFSVTPGGQLLQRTSSSSPPDGTSIVKQPLSQKSRVDSDVSFGVQGVLLAEDMMTFPKGSRSSLNSDGSVEVTEPLSFEIGHQEEREVDQEDEEEEEWEWSRKSTLTTVNRRSMSPAGSASPDVLHSSPVSARRRHHSSDGQQLSIKSNHFVGSPLIRSSSPMSVPLRATDQGAIANSVGSWQIISSGDNLRNLTSDCPQPGLDKKSHVSSCHEAVEINLSSVRWQRLDTVSQLFHRAYAMSVQCHSIKHSSGGGLTSLFDRFAEQVGLKGPRPQSASVNPRTGV